MRSIRSTLHPAPIALGLLLSPDALTRLGNGVGQSGSLFIGLIGFAALVHLANGWSYDRLQHFLQPIRVESHPLASLLGRKSAHVLPLVTRLPAFVCFGTAVLATAGFVFNEVLVYWFPNFAFAFLLLGMLLVVSVISPRAALIVQTLCVVLAVAGLVVLSVAGSIAGSSGTIPAEARPEAWGIPSVGLCLLLFTGFEISAYGPPTQGRPRPLSRFVVATAAVLFLMWTLVSAHVVPPEKLAESSVPHMLAARLILGELGRVIMGVVVLAGCCGVVNGSFLAIYGLTADLLHVDDGDSPPAKWKMPGRIAIVVLAGAIAVALGTGLAGEPELEVWMRGSALIWLLEYALFHLALCVSAFHTPLSGGAERGRFNTRAHIHGALLLIFSSMVAASVWTDPDRGQLLTFMLVAPLAACIILLPWRGVMTGRGQDDGVDVQADPPAPGP